MRFLTLFFSLVLGLIGCSFVWAQDTKGYYPTDKIEREIGKQSKTAITSGVAIKGEKVFELSDGFVKCSIGAQTGRILGVVLVASKAPLVGGVTDDYNIQFADKSEWVSVELLDKAVGSPKITGKVLEITCENPQLKGIRFKKTFTLTYGVLSKKVVVTSEFTDPPLFRVSMLWDQLDRLSAAGGGYGIDSAYGYFPDTHEYNFTMDKWGPAGVRIIPAVVIPSLGVTVGVHTIHVNNRFIHARYCDSWMPVDGKLKYAGGMTDFISKTRRFSYEYQVRCVKGDGLDYYRSYQSLPECRALMMDQKTPGWMDRVTFLTDCGPTDILGVHANDVVLPKIEHVYDWIDFGHLGDKRNSSLWVLFGWGSLGPLPTEGKWMTYEPREFPMNPEKVKWALEQFRGSESMGKVALYDWNCSFDPRLPEFVNHPDWAAKDIDGKIMYSFYHGLADYWPNVDARPNYLNPGYRKFMVGRYAELAKVFKVNSGYIDADIGYGYADWSTRTFFQQYDGYDFLRALRHSTTPELPFARNSPNNPYSDAAYWEGRGLNSAGMEERWQAMGGKMLVEKIWQVNHRWTALIKWQPSGFNEPYYCNYIVGLGYKPHAPDELVRKYGYMKAAFEMRHLELINAKFTPCFWRNENTDVEAYLLKQGNAVYASCIGHAKETKKVSLKIDRRGLPIRLNKPVFIWQIQLEDPRVMPAEMSADYEKRIAAKEDVFANKELLAKWKAREVAKCTFIGTSTASTSITINPEVRPSLLTMVAISEIPALVIGEGDEDCQMKVPVTADVALSGDFDLTRHSMVMKVVSVRKCRVALLESGSRVKSAVMNGKTLALKSVTVGNAEYGVVDIPAGGGVVKVSYIRK